MDTSERKKGHLHLIFEICGCQGLNLGNVLEIGIVSRLERACCQARKKRFFDGSGGWRMIVVVYGLGPKNCAHNALF